MLCVHEVKGVFVPVVTPFFEDGALDLESYRRHVAGLIAQDIDGIVVNGTTGEAPTLSWMEVEHLVEATRELLASCHKRIPLVVGTGTNDTAATVKRTERAALLGADAALVVTPYYNRPAPEGVLEHIRRTTEVGLSIIAYENPARTGLRLSPETVCRLLEFDEVIGLKDSSGGLELIGQMAAGAAKPVLCGEDLLFHDMLSLGAAGGMLASANVWTASFVRMYRQFQDEAQRDHAAQTFNRLLPLLELLAREPSPAPLKWLLTRQGKLASDTVRLPMTPISKTLQLALTEYILEDEQLLSR